MASVLQADGVHAHLVGALRGVDVAEAALLVGAAVLLAAAWEEGSDLWWHHAAHCVARRGTRVSDAPGLLRVCGARVWLGWRAPCFGSIMHGVVHMSSRATTSVAVLVLRWDDLKQYTPFTILRSLVQSLGLS